MLIAEKRQIIEDFCRTHDCDDCPLHALQNNWGCYDEDLVSDEQIDKHYQLIANVIGDEKNILPDSGNRREFSTGAVRDIQEGKGRCDLLPHGTIKKLYGSDECEILGKIEQFKQTGDVYYLYELIHNFAVKNFGCVETMSLELAKHFEAGAVKYGENNWQKGIPTHCYIDSATRHLLKLLRGDDDEPHDRAFVWNVVCCIWTCQNKPELNDYGKDKHNE